LVSLRRARRWAAALLGQPHFYEFGWRSPACGGALGACHALELPFVFNTLASCSGVNGLLGTAPPQNIADQIHKLWVNYATSGRLPWPEYDEESRQVYALERAEAVTDPDMAAKKLAD
jgi:para-nitrobenzyl esterase